MKPFQPFLRKYPGIANILRNGSLIVGTQWAEAGLRGVYILMIGRWLGPELYGAWSYAITSYVFAMTLILWGLETLTPLYLGQNRKVGVFLGTTLRLRLGLLAVAATALAIYAIGIEGDPLSRTALLLVLPALIGRGVVQWTRSVFLGLDRSKTAFRLAVRLRLIEVTVGFVSLWLGAGLFVLLAIHAISWVAEAGVSMHAVSQQTDEWLGFDAAELQTVLKEGAVLGLAATGEAILAAVPLILTRLLTGDLRVVGQMGLATQIAMLAVMGGQGLLTAALPVVGRSAQRGDPRLRHYPALVALGTAAAFGLAIVLAWAFGASVVSAVLGARFAPAGRLLSVALLVGGMMVLPVGAWQLLVSQGRRWAGVVAGWSGALALLLSLPAMVQASGAFGALAAAAVGWTLRAAILIGWALVPAKTTER